MAEDPPHHQQISGVSIRNQSQGFVGSFGDVHIIACKHPQAEASKQAAVAISQALSLTDPQSDRERVISAKGTRVAGTCERITHDASYRAWLNNAGNSDGNNDDNTRLLWISGGPGQGKTMMSVFLTEELERHTARIGNAELVFFFCSAQDDEHNTVIAVLRGLMNQIIDKRPQLVRHAQPYFETPEKTQQTLLSLETLWLIFSKLIADPELETIFCVLDGLDECEEKTLRALLRRITSLLAGTTPSSIKGSFKLAIVSRDLKDLRGCTRVQLNPDNNEKVASDINLFITTRLSQLSSVPRFPEIQATVQGILFERAQGTFLWVGFAANVLLEKETCTEILEALQDMPSGLQAMYARMLHQIPDKKRDRSAAILRWVTLALRPLTVMELAAAVGIDSMQSPLSIDGAIRDAIDDCKPFLEIQNEQVRLVHQSARDYLLQEDQNEGAPPKSFRIDPKKVHSELAQTCLDCVEKSSLNIQQSALDRLRCLRESALLEYAVFSWPEHAKSCRVPDAELQRAIKEFLRTKNGLRRNWWSKYREKKSIMNLPQELPLLHILCYLGFEPLVRPRVAWDRLRPRLWKSIERRDSNGNTALLVATMAGNEAVVRLLIDSGADVKAKDNYGNTVLHLTALGGHEAVVRLLIDSGADLEAKGNYRNTVLHLAAFVGREAVVRLLIDSGADLEAKDNDGKAALHWAAWRGHEAVVRLLVDSGADVEAKDNSGKTVLHRAALRGYEAVVQLLVDNGADVKAKDRDVRTAF